jgi:hypothetical protein
MEPKIGFAWLTFSAGLLLLGYGLWSLYLGKVISTWGQMVYRPSDLLRDSVGVHPARRSQRHSFGMASEQVTKAIICS